MVQYRPRSKKTGMFPFEEKVYKARPRKRGVKYGYETTAIRYVSEHEYFPDFTITLPSGHIIYIEVKGYFRVEDKRKMRLVKEQHPDLDIRMVFGRYDRKNANWCDKWGFKYAIKDIPEDWLSEDASSNT